MLIEEPYRDVNELMAHWRQGDCSLSEFEFLYRFDPSLPLSTAAKGACSTASDVSLAKVSVPGFMVLTQTCDIVRACSLRPFVEIAALERIKAEDFDLVKKARRPQYVYIPALEGRQLVADLDRVMTVEKVVIARLDRVIGCNTDDDARRLRLAIERKYARAPFPNDFSSIAKALIDRLKGKHAKKSSEGEALRSLAEIRVHAVPSWQASSIDLHFWFIPDPEALELDEGTWDEHLEAWLRLLKPAGPYVAISGTVAALEDLSALDYVLSNRLDLDHLSG